MLVVPTVTPASFMPIRLRQPTVVSPHVARPRVGRRRTMRTKGMLLVARSQVWPAYPVPSAARPGGSRNEEQPSPSAGAAQVATSVYAATSLRSVSAFMTHTRTRSRPAPRAMPASSS